MKSNLPINKCKSLEALKGELLLQNGNVSNSNTGSMTQGPNEYSTCKQKNPNNKKGDLVSGTKLCVRGCTLFSSSFCSLWVFVPHNSLFPIPFILLLNCISASGRFCLIYSKMSCLFLSHSSKIHSWPSHSISV